MMREIQREAVNHACIRDHSVKGEIQHLPRDGVAHILALERDLIIRGLDCSLRLGGHDLKRCADHLKLILGCRDRYTKYRKLVVHQRSVVLLSLVELGHGHDAVHLLHVAHVGLLHGNQAQRGHRAVTLSKHPTDLVLLGIACLLLVKVGAAAIIEQDQKLIHHVRHVSDVQHPDVFARIVLFQDGHVARAPIRVGAQSRARDKAEQIRLVMSAVTVKVLVKIRCQRGLIIQRPLAAADRIVQVRNVFVIKQILVEHGDKGKAIGRERDHARGGILALSVGDQLVVALHPVITRKIQVLKLSQVVKRSLEHRGHGGVASGCDQVVIRRSRLDNALNLGNGLVFVGILNGSGYDTDVESVKHRNISIENRIVDRLGIELGHRNLVLRPALLGAA